MLKEEAAWIKNQLNLLEEQEKILYPLGNIGSSDESQMEFQPWVRDLTNSIKQKGILLNIDIKNSPEVDLVGDLLDDDFIRELKTKKIACVLCANILTNITDKEKFAASISQVVPLNGFLIVTVSHRYPYVADPVDTLYRPNPDELKKLFPETELVSKTIVESSSFARLLWSKKKVLFITIIRLFTPFYKFKTWRNLVSYLPHVFKPVSASCIVLRRIK